MQSQTAPQTTSETGQRAPKHSLGAGTTSVLRQALLSLDYARAAARVKLPTEVTPAQGAADGDLEKELSGATALAVPGGAELDAAKDDDLRSAFADVLAAAEAAAPSQGQEPAAAVAPTDAAQRASVLAELERSAEAGSEAPVLDLPAAAEESLGPERGGGAQELSALGNSGEVVDKVLGAADGASEQSALGAKSEIENIDEAWESAAAAEDEAHPASAAEAPDVKRTKADVSRALGVDLTSTPVVTDSARARRQGSLGLVDEQAVHLGLDETAAASPQGRKVLAHELVHVAQMRAPAAGGLGSDAASGGVSEDKVEAEADAIGEKVAQGGTARVRHRAPKGRTLHKKGAPAAKAKAKAPNVLDVLKKHGISYRALVVSEAKRAGIPLALACAILDLESGGGKNVFGHDPVKPGQIWGGNVTKEKYTKYKKLRKQGYGMQGVGPMQLTWYSLQDKADALGGCWQPKWNLRVGFEHLKGLIQSYGLWDGVRRYNGSGPAAVAYANKAMARLELWKGRLQGASSAPATGGGAKPAKPGVLLNATQVKAAVTYNKGRGYSSQVIRRIHEAADISISSTFTAASVQGIAKFQKSRGLSADGMAGPKTLKAVVADLKAHHGLTKGKLLTNAERKAALAYNKNQDLPESQIKKIQKKVGVAADGILGPITTEAIAKFQKKMGLGATGLLNPATLKKLNKPSAKPPGNNSGNDNKPQPKPQGGSHFSLSEFASKDGAPFPKWVIPNVKELIEQLEVIRAALGNKPISITSGYRSPAHNAAVGGAKNSQHMQGNAADIVVSGKTPYQVYQKIEQLISAGKIRQGGLGLYSSFVHYDTRGYKARW
jgi:peptidoglycan hydrolase-like protein with peptidoglycan-binding domain